jgi:hypothetical protein
MSEPQDANTARRSVLTCLVLGLLCIAIVPGIGWLRGQFWETVVLCIGIVLLVYVAFAYISAVNGRLAALETRLADRDRARS